MKGWWPNLLSISQWRCLCNPSPLWRIRKEKKQYSQKKIARKLKSFIRYRKFENERNCRSIFEKFLLSFVLNAYIPKRFLHFSSFSLLIFDFSNLKKLSRLPSVNPILTRVHLLPIWTRGEGQNCPTNLKSLEMHIFQWNLPKIK